MKKLFLAGVLGLSLVLTACGGETKVEETTAPIEDVAVEASPQLAMVNDAPYIYAYGTKVAVGYSELMANDGIDEETFAVEGYTVKGVTSVGPPGPPKGINADEVFWTVLELGERAEEGTTVTLVGTIKNLEGQEVTGLSGQVQKVEQVFSQGLDEKYPAIWSDVVIDQDFDGDNSEHFDRKKAEFTVLNGDVTVTEEVAIANVTIRGCVTVTKDTTLTNVTINGNLIVEEGVTVTEENVEVMGERM
ncbi:hypothetical protein F9B85_06765 [Heliorestis acidaminivorans]|uniref:DUF5666 domain-containing protein n=1 Tax=Heliorestis acidaminivorans TaxID=553427 RepID=A0A6I0F0W5_9FIRM|nr:hypothetical protein [Heliorestis acidaminivorans]KAB2952964.1 hypothetical protein F9B85_06765 [Heliorestis acidaminivorans]